MSKFSRSVIRKKRALRIRKKISGVSDCPRLTVFRSNKNFSAQIIDDTIGKTLCSASSLSKTVETAGKTKVEISKLVGKAIAKTASENGISKVVFDRNGFLFKGQRIKEFANAAREAGLQF